MTVAAGTRSAPGSLRGTLFRSRCPHALALALWLGLAAAAVTACGSDTRPQPDADPPSEAGAGTGADDASAVAALTLDDFRGGDPPCYDRSTQPETALVDTHIHFRPFGGPAIPFEEVVGYLEATGVLFANVYGIGQVLPEDSPCTYYLDCPGTAVEPSLSNDLANAADHAVHAPDHLHLTLSMTFPDLADPASILPDMERLEAEFPGVFHWMGEVNLVKQALFANGHAPVTMEAIDAWAPFMTVLRDRNIPLAIHADLGNDDEPTRYLPLMEAVLDRYPDNPIVWMHMGLSRELTTMDPTRHVDLLDSMLERYPKLMLDLSWRVLDDEYFSDAGPRAVYVPFLNAHAERLLPGTDFLASGEKDFDVYRTELEVTSRILRHLDDHAFRQIALGGNYIRLLGLPYDAPPICLQ